jgi:amino acid adenylation domain-containing protein/non-ribosomal peptide synthase protein (TIGR01720 family)
LRLWVFARNKNLISDINTVNQQNLQDNFSAEKLELLAYLLEEEGIEVSTTDTIPPRKTNDNLPLSSAQQRLWFLQQLEPDNPFYNIPSALHLRGSVNVSILESCFNQIIQRHEILRTKFSSIDGKPIQIITPELKLTFPIIDLSNLPAKEKEIEAQRLNDLEAQTPFNLTMPPLLRSSLLRLNEAEYILLLTMHHIISDGWSTDILVNEIITLYQNAKGDREVYLKGYRSLTLPELTIQYADYAVWQHQWLQGDILNKQLDFWQQQLADIPPVLPLPLDKPRPHIQSYRGTKQAFVISPELTNALKTLTQQENCTLFMILLAAFKVLLYRYTAAEDIVVGSPIANRNRTEIEALIGFFVNTLVLRTNVADNPSFLELLARVKDCTLSAYANQDLPFDLIVESVKSDRHLSHTPLFQVMFVLQNAPQSNMELPGLTWESLAIEATTTKFDLTLLIEETETELKACWEYSTDLFNPETISRWSEHFQTLLSGLVANPQQPITQLPLLTLKEQQLLVEWNATQADYSLDKCIHQLFTEQAIKTPNAVAVIFGDSQLNYQELNSKANQLAHYLQQNGVKPEIIVGICCDRSLEMVISLLAVLKAGGAYIPLDPSYPPERLRFMVEDSNLAVLLTQAKLLDLVSNFPVNTICLDDEEYIIAQNPSINPVNLNTLEHLAYVIYTSGSTGTPKGVMIPHRALCNHMLWMQTELPLNSSDKVLQKTPFSFDASVWEFYAPLLVGGTLVLAKPDGHQDPGYLTELIIKENITILQLVPSLLRVLLDTFALPQCQSLRRVFCGGEILPWELQQRFYRQFEHCELYNLYGPTEAAIDTTYWLCPRQGEPINSIGKPISNVQVYILDADLQPVPIGIPGEIYIGGAGLARGYLNRPELTAEKFITVGAFRGSVGAIRPKGLASRRESPLRNGKLYKTGDKGRYLPGGNIEFLGRIDNQVKLRGFRIELGEIETQLEQHLQIKQAVVEVREVETNRQRLVAYLVAKQDYLLTSKELRSYLQERLPQYMIPGIFVCLESLPLTPNGKIDRHALPISEITSDYPRDRNLTITPRNQIESTLMDIWTEVLQVDNIGIHDNFFELGGDSIISLQVIAKAKNEGIQLTPKQIFQYQTIADLGTVANTITTQTVEQGLVTGVVPLTPIQQRFFVQQLIDSHHWNQSVILEVNDCNFKLLEQAINHLWEHHDILRSHFVETASGWECVISVGAIRESPLYNYQLSELSQDRQKQEIEAIASQLQSSFNLSEGQLIKIVWFDLGTKQSSRLLIIAHHLIIDGVSWRILLEDLETAYQQLSQGKAVKLPAKTNSYQYWANNLQEYAQSDQVKRELDYWMSLRSPLNPLLIKGEVLPVDFPEGDNTVALAETISTTLTAVETQALLSEVPSAYQTQMNDVLLTALAQAWQEWTGSNSLLIELEGHGREDILANVDLSRTVGWFTTIFPVLLDLCNNSHPGETLKTIKEQLRRIPLRGINYGVLRYLSNDTSIRDKLENLPPAAVRFNYLGQLDQITNKSALFQPATESTGNNQSLREHRDCAIEINSAIANGQLFLDWTYSRGLYRETTIQQLAEKAIAKLRSLISHCQSPDAGGYTPSDFPQMQFDSAELDLLLSEFN